MRPSIRVLQDRAVGAYLGLAAGDALGATLEFMTPAEIRLKYGVHKEIIGGGWLKLKPGQVTDDTTMSLTLGASILNQQGIYPHAIAQAYSDWMQRKPVDIGNTVRKGIIHFRYGGLPVTPECETDAGNGACMRTLPIALSTLFQSETRIRMSSRDQTHTTHNNALSDAATECVIFMIQSAMMGVEKSQLKAQWIVPLVKKFPVFDFEKTPIANPTGFIVETLQAVFQAFFNNTNFEDCLIDVVNRGGDSDTTGAILGMLAGSYYGKVAIPERWQNSLEPSIKLACEQQALQLLEFAIANNQQVNKQESLAANG